MGYSVLSRTIGDRYPVVAGDPTEINDPKFSGVGGCKMKIIPCINIKNHFHLFKQCYSATTLRDTFSATDPKKNRSKELSALQEGRVCRSERIPPTPQEQQQQLFRSASRTTTCLPMIPNSIAVARVQGDVNDVTEDQTENTQKYLSSHKDMFSQDPKIDSHVLSVASTTSLVTRQNTENFLLHTKICTNITHHTQNITKTPYLNTTFSLLKLSSPKILVPFGTTISP